MSLDGKHVEDNLPARSPRDDFYLILSSTIQSIENDPAHLRNLIYELARIKLQRECFLRNPPISILETRRLLLALETAIERVETQSSERDQTPAVETLTSPIETPEFRPFGAPPPSQKRQRILEGELVNSGDRLSPIRSAIQLEQQQQPKIDQKRNFWTVLLVAGCMAVVVSASLYEYNRRFAQFPPTSQAVRTEGERVVAARSSTDDGKSPSLASPSAHGDHARNAATSQYRGLSLPSLYGVYAISDGHLNELEPLQGRVPDPRVFMSAAINKPSRTVLPNGRLSFLIFRRDVATGAPERISIRVIAKVSRTMTFDAAGQVNISSVVDTWAIRNASYEFRVAPIAENNEMLMVRHEDPEFILTAGRYGLVVKGQAYDFTVAGPVTDPEQCLEQVEAANGSFYAACRAP